MAAPAEAASSAPAVACATTPESAGREVASAAGQRARAARDLVDPVGQQLHALGHAGGVGHLHRGGVGNARELHAVHREVDDVHRKTEGTVVAWQRGERHGLVGAGLRHGRPLRAYVAALRGIEREGGLQHEAVEERRVDVGVFRRGKRDPDAAALARQVGRVRLDAVEGVRDVDGPGQLHRVEVPLVEEGALLRLERHGAVVEGQRVGGREVPRRGIVAVVDDGARLLDVEPVDHVRRDGRARSVEVGVDHLRLLERGGRAQGGFFDGCGAFRRERRLREAGRGLRAQPCGQHGGERHERGVAPDPPEGDVAPDRGRPGSQQNVIVFHGCPLSRSHRPRRGRSPRGVSFSE